MFPWSALGGLVYALLGWRALLALRFSAAAAAALVGGALIAHQLPPLAFLSGWRIHWAGAVVPTAISLYLWWAAGTAREKARSLLAALGTLAAVTGLSLLSPLDPDVFPLGIDPLWRWGIIAGAIAYLLGRSRRAAFIAGVLGAVAHQGLQPLRRAWAGRPGGPVDIGGAGALDAVVVAGVVAVLLAEAVGEVRERLKAR